MNKIILSCIFLTFSVYATDPHLNMKSYQPAIKKLEKKTARLVDSCDKVNKCVEKQYTVFLAKRERLVKKTFSIKKKRFNKFSKNILKKEKACVLKSPSSSSKCLKKFNKEFNEVLLTLS